MSTDTNPAGAEHLAVHVILMRNLPQVESLAQDVDACTTVLLLDMRTPHGTDISVDASAVFQGARTSPLQGLKSTLMSSPYMFKKAWCKDFYKRLHPIITEAAGQKGVCCLVAHGTFAKVDCMVRMDIACIWLSDLQPLHASVVNEVANPAGHKIADPATATHPQAPGIRVCAICGEGGEVKLCSRCGTAAYCCRDHQLEHWRSGHKSTCKLRAQLVDSMTQGGSGRTKCTKKEAVLGVSSFTDQVVMDEFERLSMSGETDQEHADFVKRHRSTICSGAKQAGGSSMIHRELDPDRFDRPIPDSQKVKAEKFLAGTRRIMLDIDMSTCVNGDLKNVMITDDTDLQFIFDVKTNAFARKQLRMLLELDPAKQFLAMIGDSTKGPTYPTILATMNFDGSE